MPDLSPEAKQLFIAELCAHSIIDCVEMNWSLSNAFHMRHKLRSTDIKKIFNGCCEVPGESYERLLAIANLVACSSAAYSQKDLIDMYECSRESLKKMSVRPHFGGKIELETACANEPMNLWYGSAMGNLIGNKIPLDPHRVQSMSAGGHIIQQSAEIPMSAGKRTQGGDYLNSIAIANVNLTPKKIHKIDKNAAAFSSIEMTPISKILHENSKNFEKKWDSGRVHTGLDDKELVGPMELLNEIINADEEKKINKTNESLRKYYDRLVRDFIDSLDFLNATTAAGLEHYSHLIEQLNHRGVPASDSNVCVIKKAKSEWNKNRDALKALILKHQARLASTECRLGVKENRYPSNFFLLRPVGKGANRV